MTNGQPPDHRGPVLFLLALAMAAFLAVVWGLGRTPEPAPPEPSPPGERHRPRPGDRDGHEPRHRAGPARLPDQGRPEVWVVSSSPG